MSARRRQYYFSGGPYLEALKGLYDALRGPEAFTKLVGKPGTGKSSVCSKLSQFMQRKGHRVLYFASAIESPDMLRGKLARELDLPDSVNFARLLEDALIDEREKPMVLIFDDAHLLTDVTLLEIYRLAEVQFGNKRLINVVFCGEAELERRLLDNREFKSLLLNVSHSYRLEPMNERCLRQFLDEYTERGGLPRVELEAPAMSHFHKVCKGYPGPALTLARLLVAASSDPEAAGPVSKSELVALLQAAPESALPPSSRLPIPTQRLGLIPLAGVAVIASLALLYRQLDVAAPASATDSAASEIETVGASPFVAAAGNEDAGIDVDTVDSVADPLTQKSSDDTPAEDAAATADTAIAIQVPVAGTDINTESHSALTDTDSGSSPDDDAPGDSSLALVTAAEIGLSQAELTEPVFEEMPAPDRPDSGAQAGVGSSSLPETRPSEPAAPDALVVPSSTTAGDAREQASPDATTAAAAGSEREGEIPALEAQLREALESWISAWENRDLDAYFGHYHGDFTPRYQSGLEAWRANRERVIGNARSISLTLSELEIIGQGRGRAEVSFWLSYESSSYSDETLKRLLLTREDERWLIQEEVNLEVRR